MSNLETFRQETRAWLKANCPESLQTTAAAMDYCWGGKNYQFSSADQKLWLERCIEKGWTVPSWPKEYGGAALSRDEHAILLSEMAKLKCPPPLQSMGIWMLGPALLKFGSEALKREHLPAIARGEVRWAQGYSEPGAGSDLAGVMTKAVDKGDHYLISGQKIWTSYGDKCDAIFVLVRTNNEVSKHNGISFVLTTMEQKGVEARPIHLISGKSDFCEVFFDEARVDKDQIVGDVDRGWDVAKYLLTHEREMIAGFGANAETPAISDIAKDCIGSAEDIANSGLTESIAEFEIDSLAFEATMTNLLMMAKAGASLGASSSMLKYYGTELNKRRHEIALDVIGLDAMNWQTKHANNNPVAQQYLRSKGNSIEGGTSEIQLNIMAKFMLGLPTK